MENVQKERTIYLKKLCSLTMAIAFAASLLAVSLAPLAAKASTVKEPDTITIAWLPDNSADNEKDLREELAKIIAKATGKKVENKLTTDYTIAIAALEHGEAQIGWFGAYEYLTSHAKNPKIIPLVVDSGPSGTLKDAMYYSRFIAKKGNIGQYKDGNGYSIDHIVGERMSFVSTSSTSGFNIPAAVIRAHFAGYPKWNHLANEDLAEGGTGHFFRQVLFAGSHQLSLVNTLTGRSDVSAVDNMDVLQYVKLTSGVDNVEGAVYTVKKGADAPFNKLAGSQYVIIKSIPVLNVPIEVNSEFLTKKTMAEITKALTSDEVTNDPKIFAPRGSKGSLFVKPDRFLKVTDAWYNPMRKVLGIK
jgi:phosphonate transport system substrate-binding protein